VTQNTQAAEALSAALGYRRVIWPTSEQMLKAMAQAADEQRRVLVAASTATTQKTREGALKRAPGVLAGQVNEEQRLGGGCDG
jgi:hypothetical protein